VFCGIVVGSVPAFRVADEPAGVVFLDTRPVFRGHVLVVTRSHVETLEELASSSISGYFNLVRRLAVAVRVGLGAGGSFVAVNNRISQSVPHLHTHVVPRTKGDGLRGFFWPRTRYESDTEAEAYREKIARALPPG
jgi:histidine triad (HIT) family protein